MVKKKLPGAVKKEVLTFARILRKNRIPIDRLYVFGSYAKGTQHQWSDIDVCVISSAFTDSIEAMQYLWQKRPRDSGLTIEPIGFSSRDFKKSSSLIMEIKKTGIRVL